LALERGVIVSVNPKMRNLRLLAAFVLSPVIMAGLTVSADFLRGGLPEDLLQHVFFLALFSFAMPYLVFGLAATWLLRQRGSQCADYVATGIVTGLALITLLSFLPSSDAGNMTLWSVISAFAIFGLVGGVAATVFWTVAYWKSE
jgi:hypothetical protein